MFFLYSADNSRSSLDPCQDSKLGLSDQQIRIVSGQMLLKHVMLRIGPVCFWASRIQIRSLSTRYRTVRILIRILLSASINTVLWHESSKNDVSVASKSNKQKKWQKNCSCCLLKVRYGSADPDPYQHVTDPQHCKKLYPYKPWSSIKET